MNKNDWSCDECNCNNFAYRTECYDCGAKNTHPIKKKEDTFRTGDWNCHLCNAHNFANRKSCFKCTVSKQQIQHHDVVMESPKSLNTFKSGDWNCSHCQFHNYASRNVCHKCEALKPTNNNDGVVEIRDECSICLAEKSEYAFIPCGHKCLCRDCSKQVYDKCIMCRKAFQCISRIY